MHTSPARRGRPVLGPSPRETRGAPRLRVGAALLALALTAGCGGGPAGPSSPVSGTWRGSVGTTLVVRPASGDSLTATLQYATAPGAPAAAPVPLCGGYAPPRLSLAQCPGGDRFYFQADLTAVGDTLVSQWGAVGGSGYGDFIMVSERFTRAR